MRKARASSKQLPLTTEVMPWEGPKVYGLRLDSDCMEPEIKNGTLLVFDREQPCRPGDLVLLWRRRELVPPGSYQLVIRRLIVPPPPETRFPYQPHPDSDAAACVVVGIDNPRTQWATPCANLLGIHRCMGPAHV